MSSDTSGYVIQEGVRLSESMIWELQRAYYDREGIDAWKSGVVPSYITTNAFIAQSYARFLHAHLLDLASQVDERGEPRHPGPIHIIELGAGHGRFGFLVLKKLLEVTRSSPTPTPSFRYVMTDFVRKNIEFWRQHASLRPLVEAGVLDFARLDAERDDRLMLLESGIEISRDKQAGSGVLIANYIFDSLAIDVFRLQEGVLEESRVTISSPFDEPNLADPELIKRMDVTYDHRPAPASCYPEVEFDRILHTYARNLGDTAFTFPVGTIRCIRNLERLFQGQFLVLSADKGYNHAHQLLGLRPPNLVRHGSFSFNVNYHAIGLYFRERGGFPLHTSEHGGSIEVSAFLRHGTPSEYPRTCLAFQTHIESFGPVDFFMLQREAAKLEGTPSLEYCLAMLRLSGYDPEIFYDLRTAIRDQVEEAHSELQGEVTRVLGLVWQLFYALGNDRDVPFSMGRIYHRMGQYHQAVQAYQASLRLLGEDRATYYNLGLCHYRNGQPAAALHQFDRALELDPGYSYAREWRLRVLAEMRQGGTVSWESDPLSSEPGGTQG